MLDLPYEEKQCKNQEKTHSMELQSSCGRKEADIESRNPLVENAFIIFIGCIGLLSAA